MDMNALIACSDFCLRHRLFTCGKGDGEWG
jgi:hypothetical protein